MTQQELNDEIARQREQINWTSSLLHDSQEHSQIVRLEARLKQEQQTLRELEKMEPHP